MAVAKGAFRRTAQPGGGLAPAACRLPALSRPAACAPWSRAPRRDGGRQRRVSPHGAAGRRTSAGGVPPSRPFQAGSLRAMVTRTPAAVAAFPPGAAWQPARGVPPSRALSRLAACAPSLSPGGPPSRPFQAQPGGAITQRRRRAAFPPFAGRQPARHGHAHPGVLPSRPTINVVRRGLIDCLPFGR